MKRPLVVLLKLLATVVVTIFVLRAIGLSLEDLADLDLSAWRLRLLPLLASVLVLTGGYVMSGVLWGKMVEELGGPVLPRTDSVRVFMIANLGRYVPGKVWQIAGLAALGRARGVPAAIATAAAILGQMIALSAATLLGLGVFFGANEQWRSFGWIGLGVVIVLCLAISVPAVLDRLVATLFRIAKESPPQRRFGRSTFGVRWLGFYLVNWGLYATAFWLLYLGFHDFQPFLRVAPAFAAAYVAGYVFLFAPAGGGIRESALVVFLSPTMSPAAGAALAIVARLWTTLVELVPATVFWIGEQRRSVRPGEAA